MTSTLEEAREHARRQSGAAPVTVPSTAATDLPPGVDGATVVWDETLACGGYASRLLRRDTVLRIADAEGDACVALVVWSAANPAERLNVADTVKVQWQAYLGPGAILLSDMGRVLMTMIDDSSGRHDCLCGTTSGGTTDERSASGATPNGRDLLVLGAVKNGLQRRDVPPNVNLFKAARVADDGALTLDGAVAPRTAVRLRAEMDLIVALANVPHPLDDRPYTGTPARVTAWRGRRPDDDPFRASTPERMRAFLNTEEVAR
jgi:urea carboxylase-associated protein 2